MLLNPKPGTLPMISGVSVCAAASENVAKGFCSVGRVVSGRVVSKDDDDDGDDDDEHDD